jgi:hypothetical protein
MIYLDTKFRSCSLGIAINRKAKENGRHVVILHHRPHHQGFDLSIRSALL